MRSRSHLFAAAAGLALIVAMMAKAEATPVTYSFSVTAISGPLSGTTAMGTFTYDTSSIVPGGFNNNTGLMTALNFAWDGITYSQTTANTGALGFDATGTLTAEIFGNHCRFSGCGINGGTEQWFVAFGLFVYSIAGDGIGFGRETQALATTATPEPSALSLLGVGLAGLTLAGIKRRRQQT
jgi:hypothetical protein